MMENIPFLFHPMARITKALENEVLKMRLGADIKYTNISIRLAYRKRFRKTIS